LWPGQLPHSCLLPDTAGNHGKGISQPLQGWQRHLPDRNRVDEPGHVQLRGETQQRPLDQDMFPVVTRGNGCPHGAVPTPTVCS
ncbi:mCG5414, partial [Mus musculus]